MELCILVSLSKVFSHSSACYENQVSFGWKMRLQTVHCAQCADCQLVWNCVQNQRTVHCAEVSFRLHIV